MFMFLAIIISSGGGGAGWVHEWLPVGSSHGAFFVLLENPLVPVRSPETKRGAFFSHH
jgi:hypothetical protein